MLHIQKNNIKKIRALFLVLSAVSFAGYQEINAKYNQLESQFTQLVNLENQQYAKLRANAENASQKLEERQRLKAALEERIAKIEGSAGAKFFKGDFIVMCLHGFLMSFQYKYFACTKSNLRVLKIYLKMNYPKQQKLYFNKFEQLTL